MKGLTKGHGREAPVAVTLAKRGWKHPRRLSGMAAAAREPDE